jgi:DNA polymerase III subunit delta
MARAQASPKPLLLIHGDDDFAVQQRAKEAFQAWSAESGGMDQEIIPAMAANSAEALKALARLREALNTLPFFGGTKIVWFQDCSFLADDRTSSARDVTETLSELAQEFRRFDWKGVRLLLSAGKVDKRKSFFKACEAVGEVELRNGWSSDPKEWTAQAEAVAHARLRELGKDIDGAAAAQLVALVGPHQRHLHSEVEKLALFVGQRSGIQLADVDAIVSRGKQARAFALADALGARDLPKLLREFDKEMWEIRSRVSKEKSEIGLLYGLIGKVRTMLFLKEMIAIKWITDEWEPYGGGAYNRFKAQLARAPAEQMPADKRLNPLAGNPWMLYSALPHARNYTRAELIRAMGLLLECNRRLVTSGTDDAVVLQQTLVEIVGHRPAARRAP